MKWLTLAVLCMALAGASYGQSTTVSGTITDTGSTTWKNGTYSFSFKPAASNPVGPYVWNGAAFNSAQTIAGNLDGTGSFSVSVPSNTSITPAGSTWVFQVCPAASSTCYPAVLTITGSTQSLTSTVVPPAVSVNLTNPPAGASAYNDAEITGAKTGSFYFNLSDSTIHMCSGFPPCTWLSIGSTSSILPSNNAFTGNNTFAGTSGLNGGGNFSGSFSGNPIFTGIPNFSGGGVIQGTWTGAPTMSGLWNFNAGLTSSGATLKGTTTTTNFNNLIFVDGVTYTSIAAAYAAASNGQMVVVPCNSGAQYTETLTANLILNKLNTGIWFWCPASITEGAFNVQIPSGTNGISIISNFGKNTGPGGVNAGVAFNGYTGTGAAIQVGSAGTDTLDFTMKGIGISLFSAGNGAVGLRLNRVQDFHIENPSVVLVGSGQIGIVCDGTGNYCGNGDLLEPTIAGGGGATNLIGIQGTGPSVGSVNGANALRIFGGHISLGGASGTSSCIDIFAGEANSLQNSPDCENAENAVTIESTQLVALLPSSIRSESVVNIATFAASSGGNKITTDNATATVINNGAATNQVIYPTLYNFGYVATTVSKKGSGSADYTGANTSYAAVDTTNLCTTLTVPVGWKLNVTGSGSLGTVTAAVAAQVALSDVGATCATGGTTALIEQRYIPSAAGAGFDGRFALNVDITGDGNPHSVALLALTSTGSDNWSIQNSTATLTPAMRWHLEPSN
jgi:hypothetical protein